MISYEKLIGKDESELVPLPNVKWPIFIHKDVLSPLLELQKIASKNGFEICVASGYRNFERQLKIWNEKASGKRPTFNDRDEKIDLLSFSEEEQLMALLRFSAIPGTSRHHWGTDLDIFDASALPSPDYKVELSLYESSDQGPFGELHKFLDELIQEERALGFLRPYEIDKGAVSPERWHLSYAPLASQYRSQFKQEYFVRLLEENEIAHRELILKNQQLLNKIFNEFLV